VIALKKIHDRITKSILNMKTLKYLAVAGLLFSAAQLFTACSQYGVATTPPPPPPEEVVAVAPAQNYVWVPGYYEYRNGAYVWINGSYQIPPSGKTTYVPTQWQKTNRGYRLVKGYWQ
jgi:hypothetical protein